MLGEVGESGGRRVDTFLGPPGDWKACCMQENKARTASVSSVCGVRVSVGYDEDVEEL